MNLKRITALIAAVLFLSIGITFAVFHDTKAEKTDAVAVNDIAQSLAEQWDALGGLDRSELPCLFYQLDYVVLDNSGNRIAETRSGLNETVNSAISNRDTIADISRDGTVLGKLIIYNNTYDLWEHYRNTLLIYSIIIMTAVALICIVRAVYIDKTIFCPFRKLQTFARNVAQGNLEIPLEMDRGNLFGAFTESFDLMRVELAKARESERRANQSKKELVASLSHDIKTPVASIKAVSEVMTVKTKSEEEKKQLEIINSKADQINALITNMFTATLEELQQLSVNVGENPSLALYELINKSDYRHKTTVSPIPECLIVADMLRLQQVTDNIVSNSYKYADTKIDVASEFNGPYLEVSFRDYGPGVSPDELPLLFNKFYRAKNTEGKSGAGLGLYISQYLMNEMSGEIECRNADPGFEIRIRLRLA